MSCVQSHRSTPTLSTEPLLTVLMNTKFLRTSSVLPWTRRKVHSTNRGASWGTCQGNQPYGEKFRALDRSKSYTRLVRFDTYWCHARACCGFTSVLFTTRVGSWKSQQNTMGLQRFSHVRLLGECLDSLQYIHTSGGHLVGWRTDVRRQQRVPLACRIFPIA